MAGYSGAVKSPANGPRSTSLSSVLGDCALFLYRVCTYPVMRTVPKTMIAFWWIEVDEKLLADGEALSSHASWQIYCHETARPVTKWGANLWSSLG